MIATSLKEALRSGLTIVFKPVLKSFAQLRKVLYSRD